MTFHLAFLAAFALAGSAAAQPAPPPGEQPVDPYEITDANAGATPLEPALYDAFGGKPGVARIVTNFVSRSAADPRTADIFKTMDRVRFERTLNEQFCYLLGGGCAYTGRDMAAAHKDMGVTQRDFGIVVEHLQAAMDAGGVPFRAQNRFLAKLAPMKRTIVER